MAVAQLMPNRTRLLSLDFWDTLYRHQGTPAFRSTVRRDRLLQRARQLGLADSGITDAFFDVVDSFIKQSWQSGISSSTDDIVRHVARHFAPRCNLNQALCLLEELDKIYGICLPA